MNLHTSENMLRQATQASEDGEQVKKKEAAVM